MQVLLGNWTGRIRLQDPASDLLGESASNLCVSLKSDGPFALMNYTWSHHQSPQKGTILLGVQEGTKKASAFWLDSFHTDDRGITLLGSIDGKGIFDLLGSYKASTGPNWGWRTIITPGPKHLRLVSFNISPTGTEDLAIESDYWKDQ